jgi:hypothetical protein
MQSAPSHRPSRLKSLSVWALAGLLIASAGSADAASRSNKWRLQFSGGANSDGVITMRFTPKGGEPIVTETAIKKGTGENAVAKAVVKSLKQQLPPKQFHIERDDGEDVLVKRKWGAKTFSFKVVSNTVKGVRINPDKE